ncbi:hypothetical protein [Bauldia litoralis]|uniref:hypothetical protein n=1 Tax=Bauldia litoralis TaxID=665467 RepID=UPI003263ED8A
MGIQISEYYGIDRYRTISLFGVKVWWPFPLVAMTTSSAAVILGWAVFGGDTPRVIRILHRVARRILDAKFWVYYRFHPRHRYNLVKTGLVPGYYEKDTLILHSAMALLCEYIDENDGHEALAKFTADLRDPSKQDRNAPEGLENGQADRQSEALAIYHWWTVDRPADEARRERLTHELYGHPKPPRDGAFGDKRQQLWALDEKIQDDEQAMLHRLVNIRLSLWT